MAVISEDFVRCGCGNADFEEKKVVNVLKIAKRASKEIELPTSSEEIKYVCTNCGQELGK